jgi:uncharacterized membrane protein
MTTPADRLVEDYLERLDRELGDLPRERRRELAEELSGHIAEARADLDEETEADVRNLLERVGDPADIAAESRERPGARQHRVGPVEILALIGLLVGGLILPFVGWFVGVVLLWVSEAWTTREKLVGTLIVPGGLMAAVYLGLFVGFTETCAQVGQIGGDGTVVSETCADAFGLEGTTGLVVFLLLLLTPLATTVFLIRRLRRPVPRAYQPSAGSA